LYISIHLPSTKQVPLSKTHTSLPTVFPLVPLLFCFDVFQKSSISPNSYSLLVPYYWLLLLSSMHWNLHSKDTTYLKQTMLFSIYHIPKPRKHSLGLSHFCHQTHRFFHLPAYWIIGFEVMVHCLSHCLLPLVLEFIGWIHAVILFVKETSHRILRLLDRLGLRYMGQMRFISWGEVWLGFVIIWL
jgi:hypothetical protein